MREHEWIIEGLESAASGERKMTALDYLKIRDYLLILQETFDHIVTEHPPALTLACSWPNSSNGGKPCRYNLNGKLRP